MSFSTHNYVITYRRKTKAYFYILRNLSETYMIKLQTDTTTAFNPLGTVR